MASIMNLHTSPEREAPQSSVPGCIGDEALWNGRLLDPLEELQGARDGPELRARNVEKQGSLGRTVAIHLRRGHVGEVC